MSRRWLALGIVLLSGCPQAVGSIASTLDCGASVAADAAKGLTVTEIVEDVGERCGLDAAGVIALLAKSTDPNVTSSRAYAEVVRTRRALEVLP